MDDKIFKLIEKIDSIGLDQLSDEQLLKLQKEMLKMKKEVNPFFLRNMVPNDECLLTLFVPMYRDYLVKLMMTAIIGYMNRACDEWEVPDGVPVVPVYDYIKNPSLINAPEPVDSKTGLDPELEKDYENNRNSMKKRLVVKEFMEYLFQYDPDEHVRGAYTPNPKDPNRKPIVTPAAKLSVWMEKRRLESLRKTSPKELRKADKLVKFIDEQAIIQQKGKGKEEKTFVKEVTQRVGSRKGGYKIFKRKIKCTKAEYEEHQASKELLKREKRNVTKHIDDFVEEPKMVKFKRMNDVTLHDTVRDMLPPADIFHRFIYYFESNYEELLSAVNDIYHEKPEIDYAIHPLAMVKDLDEARKFRRKHEGNINWDIFSFQKGEWSLMGPYKQNRDKLDFQGSEMPLFEEMFQKNAKDRQLGAQIMKKRKKKKMKKQEKRVGKIPSNIRTHAAAVTDVSKYTAEVDEDEMGYTEEDDSIMMKVVRLSQGGQKVETSEFETEYEVEANVQRTGIDES